MPRFIRNLISVAPLINGVVLPKEQEDAPLFGMAAAIAAYFMVSVMMVFAKLLSDHMNLLEISFYRNAVAILPFLLYIVITGKKRILIIRKNKRGVFLRATIGFLSLLLTFGAYKTMPMADATAFLFISSLFMPIMSVLFLKEHVGIYRWAAILCGFLGALIMAMPTGDVNYVGISFAVSAAFLHGILGILLRHLGKTERPETVTFYFVFIGAVIGAIPMFWVGHIPDPTLWILILALGLAGVVTQYLLSTAFKFAPASLVTLFNYTGIVWSTIFGWFIWQDWPAWPVWIGGTIVIGANVFIVLREKKLAKQNKLESVDLAP